MKNIFLTGIFTLSSFGVILYGQNPCGIGKIIINGTEIDAVSIENNDNFGIKLPTWLSSGTTLAAGDRVFSISVIEFNKEAQPGGGNTLVFNDVLDIGSSVQTVPNGKVWKVESYSKFSNPFANGITPSNASPICDGDNVTLNATTVSGATYSWTGPNGFSSSNQNPTISNATLAANGTYFVTASLNGCSYTDSTTVMVDTLPNSNFTNTYLTAGYNGTFSPVVSGMTYSWVFNSGTPSTASTQNPQVQWASAGSYNVTLTVTDGNGCSSATTNSVTVNNCQANQSQSDFSWTPASAGYAATFTPNDMTASTYTWTFDQGTSSMTALQTPNDVVWANPGTYDVTLVTTFSGGCYTTTKQVTVSACQVNQSQSDFSWTASATPPMANDNFTFTPNNMSALSYSWTFDQASPNSSTNTVPNNISWASGGTYNVTLVTTFSGGCYTTTKQVTVFSGSQTFSYTGSQQTFTVPLGVHFLYIDALGAQGGGVNGGRGGRASGILGVTPLQTLYVHVGGAGTTGAACCGGWNGGGQTGGGSSYLASGGGGASDVRLISGDLSSRVIVAGGGGGQSADGQAGANGGDGVTGTNGNSEYQGGKAGLGWSSGGPGVDGGLNGGAGGTTTHGGGGGGGGFTSGGGGGCQTYSYPTSCGNNGTFGMGGNGGTPGYSSCGTAGGGGGWYGGGGDSSGFCGGGGGGGGSSVAINMSNVVFSGGVQSGNGSIVVYW